MASPLTNSVSRTGNQSIDGLIQGGKWNTTSLTYSLWELDGFGDWDSYSRGVVEGALDQYENVSNLHFSYQANTLNNAGSSGNVTTDLSFLFTGNFQQYAFNSSGLAVFPDVSAGNEFLSFFGFTRANWPNVEGTIMLDNFQLPFQYGSDPGGIGFAIVMHEVGHALGLKHPHDDGANNRPTFTELGQDFLDNQRYTIMSYEDVDSAGYATGNPQTLMPLDILAIQYLYGVNRAYKTGNDVYYLQNDNVVETLWDAGGYDVIDASSATSRVVLDLQENGYSSYGDAIKAIAFGAQIEAASGGAGGDWITGNGLGNYLTANAGADLLYALAGHDFAHGNQGQDTIYGNEGNDTLRGGKDADFVQGNQDADWVFGDLGDDTVRGGKGSDHVFGGKDNDMVFGDFDSDTVSGDLGNDLIFGGKQNDVLNGGAGNDTLSGDLGDDILTGGADQDVFVFRYTSGNDVIVDFEDGLDRIDLSERGISGIGDALGQISVSVVDGNSIVTFNDSGEFIQLNGFAGLSSSDFIF